ncbi:MAG: lysylphosphatidylglycerol synthase domain-containing protein [Gemmataceae bacterium]
MWEKLRRWWPVAKALLGLAIVFFVGRRFAHDLSQPQLYEQPLRLDWLVPSALCYLAGLGMGALYWWWLIRRLGHPARLLPLVRAYYVGHLGKYVPGKAVALVMRAAMAPPAGVPAGRAGLTAFYEVLTTMAGGALLAVVVFLTADGGVVLPTMHDWSAAWAAMVRLDLPPEAPPTGMLAAIALALLVAVLWPILPPVFNRLAYRIVRPFRDPALGAFPRFTFTHLAVGLLAAAVGWMLMGLGVMAASEAVPGASLAGVPWRGVAAVLAIGYVAGFLILVAPGGLGVRELFLTWLLTPAVAEANALAVDEARGKVVLVVLLLRLAWTVAELLLAAVLYPLGMRGTAAVSAEGEGT